MKRVTGIGGIFFKARDPQALAQWYRVHLGMDVEEWGGVAFRWVTPDNPGGTGTTVWSPFKADTTYFSPGRASFMVNYRVDDLHAVLAALRAEGCQVEDKVEESSFGKFGWVIDPEGNKLELWQPPEGQ
jgi:predicted enzyme related to lactoylglutathione lyase